MRSNLNVHKNLTAYGLFYYLVWSFTKIAQKSTVGVKRVYFKYWYSISCLEKNQPIDIRPIPKWGRTSISYRPCRALLPKLPV